MWIRPKVNLLQHKSPEGPAEDAQETPQRQDEQNMVLSLGHSQCLASL